MQRRTRHFLLHALYFAHKHSHQFPLMHTGSAALGTSVISRCESPGSAMLKVARRNGRTCRIMTHATEQDLVTSSETGPVLVYCRTAQGGRYLIVRSVNTDTVHTVDSVTGEESDVPLGEFLRNWYGKGILNRTGWMMAIQ